MLSFNHSMNLKLQAHNTIRAATYYLPLLNNMLGNSSPSSFGTIPMLKNKHTHRDPGWLSAEPDLRSGQQQHSGHDHIQPGVTSLILLIQEPSPEPWATSKNEKGSYVFYLPHPHHILANCALLPGFPHPQIKRPRVRGPLTCPAEPEPRGSVKTRIQTLLSTLHTCGWLCVLHKIGTHICVTPSLPPAFLPPFSSQRVC